MTEPAILVPSPFAWTLPTYAELALGVPNGAVNFTQHDLGGPAAPRAEAKEQKSGPAKRDRLKLCKFK
jgi:hypothetical protein